MAKAKTPPEINREPAGWTFTCRDCGFVSSGWRTRALAEERSGQHRAEHEGGDPVDAPRNDPEE